MIFMKHGAQDAVAAIAIDREARRLQKEADAALVEAAGCTCKLFAYCRGDIDATDPYAHDPQEPRCPTTLADQIRRQKP